MVSQTDQQFLSRLREELECTVCSQISSSPIYACRNGHLLCGFCFEKIQTCGACKTFFSPNSFAERLSERYELTDECKNKTAGCEEIIKCSLMKAHIKQCDYRPIECKADINNKDCYGKLFELKSYMNHAIETHKRRTFSTGESCGFSLNVRKGDDVKSFDTQWEWVFYKFNDVPTIGLRVAIKLGMVFWWLGIADGNKMASSFRCKTAFLKYNGITEQFEKDFSSWSLPLIPLNNCLDKEEILKSGKIGSIYYTALEHVAKKTESTGIGYVFHIKVKINKIDNIEKELTVKRLKT